MSKLIDLTEQRFGRWLVLRRAANYKNGCSRWLCRCDCGKEKIVLIGNLRSGHSGACRNCARTIHGLSKTNLHNVWCNMIQRCEDSNCKAYKYYGGRGIKICSEWRKDFMAFRRWALANGYKEGLIIDRINNDGDYKPENCQCITRSENSLKSWHIDGSHRERKELIISK